MNWNHSLTIIFYLSISPIVLAQGATGHACDSAGSVPTATIVNPPELIDAGSGEKVIGTGITVTLEAKPVDKDKHKPTATSSETNEDDTFDNTGAIEWSEKNGKGSFDDKNKKTTKFTTTNDVGTYNIILKIKDDGKHYQDHTSLTQAATLDIKVVNPDSVRITSQTSTLTLETTTGGVPVYSQSTPVCLQVTYKGKDLPWVGQIVEKFTQSSNYNTRLPLPYSYNASGGVWFNGNWCDEGDYAPGTNSKGQLTDTHTNCVFGVGEGTYLDFSGEHEVGFIQPNVNTFSLKKFKDKDYTKHEAGKPLEPVHDEQP